jgi:hypothetical protein
MAFTNLSTRSTGYLVTAANWNELVNNWLTVATSAGLIKHEFGGIEADISAIAAGGILRGSGTGTMAVLASFLNGSGHVTHEYGGIEADISAIAAGGIVRGSGTGTMAILTKGSALQVLRVNAGASDLEYATLGTTSVVKNADETISSNATLQNDDELAVAVSASTDYIYTAHILMESSSNADFKYAFTLPGSPTLVGHRTHLYVVGGAASTSGNKIQSDDSANQTTDSLTLPVGNTTRHGIMVFGAFRNGSNSGNLQLQWAQGTSHSDDTIVGASSWLSVVQAS